MKSLQQLAERRAALIERSARQRIELGEGCRPLEATAGFFDRGFAVARSVRSHPGLVLAAGAAAVFLLRKHISFARLAGTALNAARLGAPVLSILLSRRTGR